MFDRIFRLGVDAGLAIIALIVVVVIVGVAEIKSIAQTPSHGVGTTNLRVVPTLRSVTISAAPVDFARCQHGTPPRHSTKLALGFPNGHCYIGTQGKHYPIKITNGLAARILVGSSNAVPSDGGRQWVPCMSDASLVPACVGPGSRPGKDQFVVDNFSRYKQNAFGLSKTMLCDGEFGPTSCFAGTGQVAREGVVLIGPRKPDDNSTTWTVTITWMAAPRS